MFVEKTAKVAAKHVTLATVIYRSYLHFKEVGVCKNIFAPQDVRLNYKPTNFNDLPMMKQVKIRLYTHKTVFFKAFSVFYERFAVQYFLHFSLIRFHKKCVLRLRALGEEEQTHR